MRGDSERSDIALLYESCNADTSTEGGDMLGRRPLFRGAGADSTEPDCEDLGSRIGAAPVGATGDSLFTGLPEGIFRFEL